MNPDEAQAALAGIHDTEARLAQRIANCPPWRHAAFGGIYAILVGTATISTPVQLIGTAIVLVLAAAIFISDRRRYGVFVNGYRRGATLPLTLTFVGTFLVLMLAALYMRENGFSIWSKLGLAMIAFAIATAISVRWNAIFRRELSGGAR